MMKVTAREDIEAPLDKVFTELCDFESIERQALRRGIEVRRTDTVAGLGEGMTWHARFRFRGKAREADITLESLKSHEQMVFHTVSGGLETRSTFDLVALSRRRTRVSVETELLPKTLSARLLVQSMKLAKGGIEKRFRKRMAGYARDLENKLRNMA